MYADELVHQKRDPSEPDIETVSIVRLKPLRCVAVGVIARDGGVRLLVPAALSKRIRRSLEEATTTALAAIDSAE